AAPVERVAEVLPGGPVGVVGGPHRPVSGRRRPGECQRGEQGGRQTAPTPSRSSQDDQLSAVRVLPDVPATQLGFVAASAAPPPPRRITTWSTIEPTGCAGLEPLFGPHQVTLPRSNAAFGGAHVPLRMLSGTSLWPSTSIRTYVRTCSWFSTELAQWRLPDGSSGSGP